MRKIITIFVLLFAACIVSHAQSNKRDIQGSVWILPEGETTAERVCGATVSQLDTNNGTSTDYNGIFHMTITDENLHHTLRASFFGCYPQDQETKSNREFFNNFIFILHEDTEELLSKVISKTDDEEQ